MANYMTDFHNYSDKLGNLLAENDLIYNFNTGTYPSTLKVYPCAAPAAQMSLLAAGEEGGTSPDARLIFGFPVGAITVKIVGRLAMSDALMNKIKGYAKKMHKSSVEAYYAEHVRMDIADCFASEDYDTAEPDDEDEEEIDESAFDDFYDDESEADAE